MCKKQASVFCSSTESEVISFTDLVIEVWHFFLITFWHGETRCETKSKATTPTSTPKRRNTATEILLIYLMWITLSQTQNLPHIEAMLHIFEDNEAVIRMIIKSRSPTMRHVSRTPQSRTLIGNITSFFDVLLQPFQSNNKSKTMSKRQQEEKSGEEERVVAKSKPMKSLVSKTANRSPTLGSGASSPGTFGAQSSLSDRTGITEIETNMLDIDVNGTIWRIFMSATIKAAAHLGQDYRKNLRYNQEYRLREGQNTVRYFAEIDLQSQKLRYSGYLRLNGKKLHG